MNIDEFASDREKHKKANGSFEKPKTTTQRPNVTPGGKAPPPTPLGSNESSKQK